MFGLSLRQTVGFVESLFCLAGLDWAVPDYSTLSRRQGQLTVVIPARASASGLALLVDSTGVKVSGGRGVENTSIRGNLSPPVA